MSYQLLDALYQLDINRRRKLQVFFTELGLTPGQPRILRCLLEGGRALTQRELADECQLDATTLSRALDRLEQSGLVCRAPHDSSRRANLISLTPEGESRAGEVAKGFRRMEEALGHGLSTHERDSLFALLEKVKVNLDEMGKIGEG